MQTECSYVKGGSLIRQSADSGWKSRSVVK